MINRIINNEAISIAPRVNIYIATVEDVPRLLPLAYEFNAESGRNLVIDDASWCGFWTEMIARDLGCAFYAAEHRDGDPVGLIMAVTMPSHIDQKLEVTETLWFLSKSYRKARTGMELLVALERFAEVASAKRVNITHLANSTGERMRRVFVRRGYTAAECGYYTEVVA